MNNTFNFKRFSLLFKKHTIEHAKTYLLSIIVVTGVLFIILGYSAFSDEGRLDGKVQPLVFMFVMLAAGSIFTSLVFTDLGDKKKAIPLLTLPVSHLEKYLVAWLYSYVIFQVVFISVFYFADWTVISISVPPANYKNQLINVFEPWTPGFVTFIYYGLFHAFTFWGAVFFEKLHFIKTAFVFFICLIALILINKPLLSFIGDDHIQGKIPFGPVGFLEGDRVWEKLPDNSTANMGLTILGVFILLIWVSTFFRLKEKQV